MKKSLLFIVFTICLVLAGTMVYMRISIYDEADAPPARDARGTASLQKIPVQSTPSPEERLNTRAEELLDAMTLEEKAWQLLIVRPEGICGAAADTAALIAALEDCPVGGLVLSAQNLVTEEQTLELISSAQEASRPGLFISVDEEGGDVARVEMQLGTTSFRPMYYYKDDGPDTAYSNAQTIALDIARFGFNLDFAPVADIWSNPSNTVIGTRAYGDTPELAASLVPAAVRGFQESGIIATLKHFPGHGGTLEDSHNSSAYSDSSLEQLREFELRPFEAGIEAGADMVMIGHITMTSIDDGIPATFSHKIVTELLRDELGFDGVVITDGLEMSAITVYSSAEIAVRAINAGIDILLAPTDAEAAANAIMDEIPESRIDESVLRILKLKLEYGIIE